MDDRTKTFFEAVEKSGIPMKTVCDTAGVFTSTPFRWAGGSPRRGTETIEKLESALAHLITVELDASKDRDKNLKAVLAMLPPRRSATGRP